MGNLLFGLLLKRLTTSLGGLARLVSLAILRTLAVLWLLGWLGVLFNNWFDPVMLDMGQWHWASLPLGPVLLASAGTWGGACLFWLLPAWALLRRGNQAAQRDVEKSRLAEARQSDYVRALEAKIETLETALAQALRRREKT